VKEPKKKKKKAKMVFNILVASSVIKSVGTSLWLIPFLLAAISYYRYDRVDPETRVVDQQNLWPEYDFIVIGGGSAGKNKIILVLFLISPL
jgi:hypothetical protein